MARPRLIQDSDLLSAAREVFVEQGFSATTATIAARAGVSEGTLFKRFSSKEELFVAALGITEYGAWRAELLGAVGQGQVQRNLERAALGMLSEAAERLRTLMAIFSRGIDPSHNPLMQRLAEPAQADQQALTQYLQAEMDLGRLRPIDPEVTAMLLLGALNTLIHTECLPSGAATAPSQGRFVRGILDVLWPGLQP